MMGIFIFPNDGQKGSKNEENTNNKKILYNTKNKVDMIVKTMNQISSRLV